MLLYPRHYAGVPLLFFMSGSALPRAVLPAIVSAGLAVVFELTMPATYLDNVFIHPYPYQIFASVLGFAVVFRLSQAYARNMEGLTHQRTMSSKWGDAAAKVLSFDVHSKPGATPEDAPEDKTLAGTRALFFASVSHRFSLLHGLACSHLRREVTLREFGDATSETVANGEKEVTKRPIKAAAQDLPGPSQAFMQSLFPVRNFDDHFKSKPLKVLGGLSSRETAYYEPIDSETRVAAAFTQLMGTINSRRFAGGMWVDPPAVASIHGVSAT
jgi:hypothetical protein